MVRVIHKRDKGWRVDNAPEALKLAKVQAPSKVVCTLPRIKPYTAQKLEA